MLLVGATLAWRPLTPVDETRYATVAWEMWQSGDPISLRLNGALYGDKPPLLFWLINLGWWVVGPSAWWPQLLTALFAIASSMLTVRLARQLAPDSDAIVAMTAMITASTLFWMVFTGAVMFDIVLTFCALLGASAVIDAARHGGQRAWLAAGAAIGLGILTKGPVMLLHVLPLALLAPWWRSRLLGDGAAQAGGWGRWYGGVGLCVVIAALIALAWAIPAALAGGATFGREIFWSQSADRIATTAHHAQPPWYYVATLPLLLLPWLFVTAVWRGGARLWRRTAARPPGLRAALAWLLSALLAFSLFRSKQPQYLLPEVPALAFVMACALHTLPALRRWEAWLAAAVLAALAAVVWALVQQPGVAHLVPPEHSSAVWASVGGPVVIALWVAWRAADEPARAVAVIGSGSVATLLAVYAGVGRVALASYDIEPMARQLARLQVAGRPIAHFGKYHGQYQFLGRLQRPLSVIEQPDDLRTWAASHPDGGIVAYSRSPPAPPLAARAEFVQVYKGGYAWLWRSSDFVGIAPQWFALQDKGP